MTSKSLLSASRTLHVSSAAIPEILGEPALVVAAVSGTEAVNQLFDYQILLKTPATLRHMLGRASNFDTSTWRGKSISLQIQLEGSGSAYSGAGVREINGIIDSALLLRVEGGQAVYQVVMKPWLHQATLRQDCRIFQDQTVTQIIAETLSDYPYPLEWRLIDNYPKRDYVTMFNESHFAFISRLCETWGINYFFVHDEGQHRLIFADNMAAFHRNASAGYQQVLFHADGAVVDQEYIHSFVLQDRLASSIYTSRDYDYACPRADLTVSMEDPEASDGGREVYAWHSAHSGQAHFVQPGGGNEQAETQALDDGRFLARIRQERLHCDGLMARGSGHLKGMQPGHRFQLQRHPRNAANIDYAILSTRLSISEVATQSQSAASAQAQRHAVQLDFEAYPLHAGSSYRPAHKTAVPRMPGVESALVVGPGNDDVTPSPTSAAAAPAQAAQAAQAANTDAPRVPDLWVDALGRIKVQFHWDRLGRKDQNSSCWVRVAMPWAGNQLGSMHLPRIGQEVLITFISGNPDLPVCTGRVHNQHNLPPWRLPGQQALSGLRSRELSGGGGNSAAGRSNHLLLDDSAGQIQAQLKSDHLSSQLSLGHICRIDDHQGRKDVRGQGFALESGGHGAIRASRGLLITTEARDNACAHITDMAETQSRLRQAHEQHGQLADLAQQHQAQDNGGDQSEVVAVLQQQEQAIGGMDGIGGIGGSGSNASGSADGSFPELSEPHLVLASPAGIASSTPQSTHIASGEQTAITSGQHLSLSVGQRLLASVRNGIRLFCYQAGMKLVAAGGDIELRALKDSINILAKLNITHTAERITICAKEEVLINGGGSYTKWQAAGIESGTSGSWAVQAASKRLDGPVNRPAPVLPEVPLGKDQLAFQLQTLPGVAHVTPEPYELYRDGKFVEYGVTDARGRVLVNDHTQAARYDVKLSDGSHFILPTDVRPTQREQQLARRGLRDLGNPEQGRSAQTRKRSGG